MHKLAIATILISFTSFCFAQEKPVNGTPEYEMTNYVLGMLRKGPNFGTGTKEENQRLMEGHLANIRKMAAEGKMIVAGPLTDNGDLRGIFIFKAKSPDDVRAMTEEDPAVKAGRFVVELHPWFAAAGLRVNDPQPAKQ
jgi:uncharacterized protein YciI